MMHSVNTSAFQLCVFSGHFAFKGALKNTRSYFVKLFPLLERDSFAFRELHI